MPARLSKIDELTRLDHSYLEPDDECYYLGEYTARMGYAHSDTNQLIYNFKKSPEKKGRPEWHYKEAAIQQVASQFRAIFSDDWLSQKATLVPIPPSKHKADPLYDDRMIRMLRQMTSGLTSDVRELVIQKANMHAAHDETHQRPTPTDLIANYEVPEDLATPAPRVIAVFDDLITTGCHFKAMQAVLGRRFPGVPMIGFFIARRVPEAHDVEEIDPSTF